MFSFNFSPPTSRMWWLCCERKKTKARRKGRREMQQEKERNSIKGKSKSFSYSQDQIQSSPKLMESEFCQQQRGTLPWLRSTIFPQASLCQAGWPKQKSLTWTQCFLTLVATWLGKKSSLQWLQLMRSVWYPGVLEGHSLPYWLWKPSHPHGKAQVWSN